MIFVHNVLNGNVPTHFKDYFSFIPRLHEHNTINNPNSLCSIPNGSLKLPYAKTKAGKCAIKYICVQTWNTLLKKLKSNQANSCTITEQLLHNLKLYELKKVLKEYFINCF